MAMQLHETHREAAEANRSALDWLCFFLADVMGGVGPFLAIFLTSSQHWDAGRAGIALTIGGVATVLARGPCGALVDAITWKRTLIVASAAAVGGASIAMTVFPSFWPIAVAQSLNGIADAIFPLAVTAISLGIVGRQGFAVRVGRNEAWNHAGNVATAIVAGLAGYLIAPAAVLWMVAALSAVSAIAVCRVDARMINHATARGEDDGLNRVPEAVSLVLASKPLLWFTAAITLFHFANAAMLPLAGEKLSLGKPEASPLFMALCIVTAQMVMVPMAILAGRKADAWGRKPLFMAGFAVLPVRGLLFALADDPYSMVAIQVLDGVGAGIFGALFYIVVSDFTRGSGRYNLALGAAGASWGLGAALSNGVAGMIVNGFGFAAAFLFLGACAFAAFVILLMAVPESRNWQPCSENGANAQLLPETVRA
jgi:MFS family permease